MSQEAEQPWWHLHHSLFGNVIPPERCAAWSEIWASKGYENSDISDAVLEMARLPVGQRPQWPNEHIDTIEDLMRPKVLERALAGKVSPERIALLMPDWQADLKELSDEVRKVGLPIETPQSTAFRLMSRRLTQVNQIVRDAKLLESKGPPLPQMGPVSSGYRRIGYGQVD